MERWMTQLLIDAYTNRKENFHCRGVEVVISETARGLVITIPGTNEFKDWIRNFRCDNRKTLFHAGFASGWVNIRNYVEKMIPKDASQVILNGHSMGAAIAAIGMWDLVDSGVVDWSKISGYLFGLPRFCTPSRAVAWSHIFEDKFKAYRNGNDIVSIVPLRYMPPWHFYGDISPVVNLKGNRFKAWAYALTHPGLQLVQMHNIRKYNECF